MSEEKMRIPEEVKADIDTMSAELAGIEAEPGPSQAEMARQEQNFEETKSVLVSVLGPAFALLAPGWGVTKDEVDALSGAYAGVLDKYFPDGLTKFGVEINAFLITAAIIVPRLGMARQVPEQEAGDHDGQA